MSLFWIKIIALLTMVFDHIGVFVFPDNIYLRLIGRLSFPLFAWAIANGAHHTKNINKYLIRLIVLAFISQIPYQLLFTAYGNGDPGLNILFTLSLGLLGIILFKKTDFYFNSFYKARHPEVYTEGSHEILHSVQNDKKYSNLFIKVFISFLLSLIAVLIDVDYGIFGVLSIIIFYSFFTNRIKIGFLFVLLVTVYYCFPVLINSSYGGRFNISYLNILQLFSTAALLIIFAYNQKIGHKLRYLFYLFYPLHLLAFYLLKLFNLV